jgi:glycine C-acetyltransferase
MSTRPADLFDRCREFGSLLGELKAKGLYEALYRVTLAGPLDHRITVVDPFTSRLRDMVCFDSNSYLGLHRHPRVLRAARRALARFGAGTPSAPLLGGTSTLLRELERTVSDFHGREAAIVFPSGYAANVGLLTALVGRDDIVACDRFSHASLRDGVRFAGPRRALVYRHRDVGHLERLLAGQRGAPGARLVATDGVFSMHGSTAPLPALRRAADAHGARLLVDEAHSVGVLGPTGRGLEEAFEMPGAIDILMGTFSKAPGASSFRRSSPPSCRSSWAARRSSSGSGETSSIAA